MRNVLSTLSSRYTGLITSLPVQQLVNQKKTILDNWELLDESGGNGNRICCAHLVSLW